MIKFNREFITRIVCMIFSLVLSVLFWLYVTVSQQEERTLVFDAIRPVLTNEESLEAKNLYAELPEDLTVSLTLRGLWVDLARLEADDIAVTVDAARIDAAGLKECFYVVTVPENITVEQRDPPVYVDVRVEALITREFPVEPVNESDVSDTLYVDEFSVDPAVLSVTGRAALVEKIASVSAVLQRNNAIDGPVVNQEVPFVLRDESGGALELEGLTLSEEHARVSLGVLTRKTVTLDLPMRDGGGATAVDVVYKLDPVASIVIAGDEEVVSAINAISLDPVDLKLTSLNETFVREIRLPDGVLNLSEVEQVTVSLNMPGLGTIILSVLGEEIQCVNVPEGYTPNVVSPQLGVLLRGPSETVGRVETAMLSVEADLSQVDPSVATTQSAPVSVRVEGADGVALMGEDLNVAVRLNPVTEGEAG